MGGKAVWDQARKGGHPHKVRSRVCYTSVRSATRLKPQHSQSLVDVQLLRAEFRSDLQPRHETPARLRYLVEPSRHATRRGRCARGQVVRMSVSMTDETSKHPSSHLPPPPLVRAQCTSRDRIRHPVRHRLVPTAAAGAPSTLTALTTETTVDLPADSRTLGLPGPTAPSLS